MGTSHGLDERLAKWIGSRIDHNKYLDGDEDDRRRTKKHIAVYRVILNIGDFASTKISRPCHGSVKNLMQGRAFSERWHVNRARAGLRGMVTRGGLTNGTWIGPFKPSNSR